MVFSELAAATLIAVCGLKKSYRIVLRTERIVRRQINKPSPIVEGYESFPRFFVRRVFRAGLGIAMKWEGRAKNAAQRAAEARLRAIRAGKLVASRADDIRSAAKDQASAVRERAEHASKVMGDIRTRAKDQASAVRERAEHASKVMGDIRTKAKDQASAVRERVSQRYRSGSNKEEQVTGGTSRNARTIVPPSSKDNSMLKMIRTRF